MGLPIKPLEHTRPETIAMPVNKSREAQSLWELPALRPSGGDRAVGRDIIYTIIIYYILLYIELRESQTAKITFSSMLQFIPDCIGGWTLIGCYVTHVTLLNADWLSSRQKLVAGFLSRKILPIRVYTFTLYGILSTHRVWCERTVNAVEKFQDKQPKLTFLFRK